MMTNYRHQLAPDYQAFDEVRITTVPRFKTSELSGDEWRISAVVQFIKKGIVVGEKSFDKVDTAIKLLTMMRVQWAEIGKGNIEGSRQEIDKVQFCDQEGCNEKATVFYEMIHRDCSHCGSRKMVSDSQYLGIPYAQFCERHKYRGDSDLQDNNDNYKEINNPKKIKMHNFVKNN